MAAEVKCQEVSLICACSLSTHEEGFHQCECGFAWPTDRTDCGHDHGLICADCREEMTEVTC